MYRKKFFEIKVNSECTEQLCHIFLERIIYFKETIFYIYVLNNFICNIYLNVLLSLIKSVNFILFNSEFLAIVTFLLETLTFRTFNMSVKLNSKNIFYHFWLTCMHNTYSLQYHHNFECVQICY